MLHLNTLPHPSLPPSPGSLHTHTCIPRKGPDNLMPLSHPPPRDHPYPFPTHSLSGANMQSISPAGFRGVAVLPAAAAPSFLLRPRTPRFREQEGGGGGGETLERERGRARVLEGKVWSRRSLVGDGEKRGRKGGRGGRWGCRVMPAGLRNAAWQVSASCCERHGHTPPKNKPRTGRQTVQERQVLSLNRPSDWFFHPIQHHQKSLKTMKRNR